MIAPHEAWDIIVEQTTPLPTACKSLIDALDHVLVTPVLADRDIPSADRAAMDGYAVKFDDLITVPSALQMVGEVAAGSSNCPVIEPGECVRIFTGANLPPSADTVVMQEDTVTADEDHRTENEKQPEVRFLKAVQKGQHIFRRGENAANGEEVVPAGTRVTAAHIGICAAVGCSTLEVCQKPRVSILTTGRELKSFTDEVGSHEIRDSNGPMLEALLAADGMPLISRQSVTDKADILLKTLSDLLAESDVLLVTGGVSVGDYDLVPAVISEAGGEIRYHGVAMKPGKPQLFATAPDKKCIFGLPGNPLSVMTGYQEFVLPALRLLSGIPAGRCTRSLMLPLAADAHSRGKRRRYVPARILRQDGHLAVEPVRFAGSADLVAGGRADGSIVVPDGQKLIEAGTVVEFRPWGDVL